MRCLALAQGWTRTGGGAVFALAQSTLDLEQRLRKEGMEVNKQDVTAGSADDAAWTISQARACAASWIVADGYCFGAEWQKRIKDAGFKLLIVDDYSHAERYYADLILNQNISAREQMYTQREPSVRLLLGTRYALLRHEFMEWRDWRRANPAVARKVLVAMGGSEPDNVTGEVIQALPCLTDLEVVVAVGGSNPNLEAIKRLISDQQLAVRLVVNTTKMPELMAWADVAVAASCCITWELALMQLPSLVIVLATNQADIAAALDREGVSISLGEQEQVEAVHITAVLTKLVGDLPRRSRMSELCRQIVDGKGVSRVVTRMRAAHLTLRRALQDDCRTIWEWANDPEVRASAFNSEPIPWETHLQWFDGKLRDPQSLIFVGLSVNGKPFGQVRFDWDEHGAAEVDASVDRGQRNGGLGSALIQRAVEELFTSTSVGSVNAHIKPKNGASILAFEKADFRRSGVATMNGKEVIRLTITRSDE